METQQTALPSMKELTTRLALFARADNRTALVQMGVTLALYALGWVAMYFSLQVGYWLTLMLSIPTAAFLVRIFIFFHDCGHNSFFQSITWNRRIGFWLGVLVFTPGEQWWKSHAIHHATSGNLDKRGVGDVTTLTVKEFRRLSPGGRLGYRLFRHPLVIFLLGPIWMFLISHRWPAPMHGKKETLSVVWANLAILALGTGLSLLMGFWNYVLIQLPVIWLGGMIGIWMFYVQHQFTNVYWAHDAEWNYASSAILGASYYRLPGLLQWVSGNIGFHHIHHLAPKVANYHLEAAYRSDELFRQSPTLDIKQSLATIRLALYDEAAQRMVSFKQAGF